MDFLGFYIGFDLAKDGHFASMYNTDLQSSVQKRVYPEEKELSVFPRPVFYSIPFFWLAWFPLKVAFKIWLALQLALLLACCAWAWKRFGDDALIWGALSLPAFIGIASGQDTGLMLAIAVAGYVLAERGENFLAGAVWGLALAKFNLILLLPLAMLATRRYRMLGGFCTVAAVFGAITLRLLGFTGIQQYLALIQTKKFSKVNPSPELMMNVQGIAANLGEAGRWLTIPLTVLVLVLAFLAMRNAPLWAWTCSTFTASLLAVPHVFAYNAAILLLPIWLAYSQSTSKLTRIAAATYGVPLLYGLRFINEKLAAAVPLVLIVFLAGLARERFESSREPTSALSKLGSYPRSSAFIGG
jgi:hypothetical protein